MEDRRSEEEKERDRQREVEENTYPLFDANESTPRPATRSAFYDHYDEVKRQFPQAIVMLRLGDFYEMFNGDAVIASRELDLVLTSRKVHDFRVQMAGVPHHAADKYVFRLVEKGYHVAICEPFGEEADDRESPREVVRVVKLAEEDGAATDFAATMPIDPLE
jgi:DNA mismatch repair ATPase MutS